RPTLFAYPYGESSLVVQRLVEGAGFVAAFGQHSGAIGSGGNRFDLPRFAMNETYGGEARFRLAVNALPLPVTDVTPADPLITGNNPPAMGFTITRALKGLDRLACFSSHAGRARLERLGQRRIEVRVDEAFPKGRTRVNCTLPADGGRWHWFGRQFYRPG
ncbi:MAG: chitin deacetylase, partial [Rhodospirillales bacterium]